MSSIFRPFLVTLVLVALMIGAASNVVIAAPMPGGVYIGYVYVNGVEVSNFTVGVSLGPTYYWTEYYPPGDPVGTYEMDITIPDGGVSTGDIVCTVPGVGTQTLQNVDLNKDNATCNWYFTTSAPINWQTQTLNMTFDKSDFAYGPQDWVPYAFKNNYIYTGSNSPHDFSVMYIDLGATPWSYDNSYKGGIKVDYSFENLSSIAAFNVMGYTTHQNTIADYPGICYINTQSGNFKSGYFVSGNSTLGGTVPVTENLSSSLGNNLNLRIANPAGPMYNTTGDGTYWVGFSSNPPTQGKQSLRLTTDLSDQAGQMIYSDAQAGSFYVISNLSGSYPEPDDVILMLAVNGTIPDTFSVNIKASMDKFPSEPVASFSASPLVGVPPLQVSFTDTSSNDPDSWSWDFGDGNTSTLQNPVHTYSTPGDYSVKLNVSNLAGNDAIIKNGCVKVAQLAPIANFTTSEAYGNVPLTVQFVDHSDYVPMSWHWDFGDGNTSKDQNPVHVYSTPGIYTASLTVSNAAGPDTMTKTNYVIVNAGETPISVSGVTANTTYISGFESVNLSYTLAGAPGNEVYLQIYDENNTIVGAVDVGTQRSGPNFAVWNGSGDNGKRLPAGNYTVKLVTSNSFTSPVVLYGKADTFTTPVGIAVDSAGNVYTAVYGNNEIAETYPNGTTVTYAGGITKPAGLAIDSAGDIFVTDQSDNSVKEVYPDGTVKTLAAGFGSPYGLAVDQYDNVYLADQYNSSIIVIRQDGTIGILGDGLSGPSGVAVDASGNVYVGDTNNDAVKEIYPNGTTITLAGGLTYGGSSVAASPLGVAVDPAGNVYFGNSEGIHVIAPDGTISSRGNMIGVYGLALDSSGDLYATKNVYAENVVNNDGTGPGQIWIVHPDGSQRMLKSGFARVFDTATDSKGDLYMLDTYNDVLDVLYPNGTVSIVPPTGIYYNPYGVGVDSEDNVYVADTMHSQVRKINSDGTVDNIGDGFGWVWGVKFDPQGNAYVADGGSGDTVMPALKKVCTNGSTITLAKYFNDPTHLALDRQGNVFLADHSDAIWKISPNGTKAKYAKGFGYGYPDGVAIDSLGNVFVADTQDNRLVMVYPNRSMADIGSFDWPSSVNVDAHDNIYVTDSNGVWKFSMAKSMSDPISVTLGPAGEAYTLNLKEGWNLVSIPLENDTLWASQLKGTGVSVVATFNRTTNGFNPYDVGTSPAGDDIRISIDTAYFMLCDHDTSLTILGIRPAPHSVYLASGWNMVGWSSLAGSDAKSVANGIPGDQVIARYNSTSNGYDPHGEVSSPDSDSFAMVPGTGYFILSDSDENLSFGGA